MILTDIKQVYLEFQFWKKIYTTLNRAEEMLIYPADVPTESYVNVIFNSTRFYKFFGKIYGDNTFVKWINSGHTIKMNLTDLKEIKSALKKNCVSIETTETSFKYTYNVSTDDGEKEVSNIFTDVSDSDITKNFISDIKNYVVTEHIIQNDELTGILDKDAKSVFISVIMKDGKLVSTKSEGSETILEIPRSKALSSNVPCSSKDDTFTGAISYTDRDLEDHRLVSITTKSDLLELTQTFKTI